jgi:hypothetical protein
MQELLQQLLENGHRLYKSSASDECAETFRRASQLASALRERRAEVHTRFWEGCALHGGGRLRESLAVMAPVLSWTDVSLADEDVYRLATRYLRVLVELPGDRWALERAIAQVEQGLLQAGKVEWRSRILILRSRLALSTGEWRQGLRIAQTALENRRVDSLGCTFTSHYWIVVLVSIWLGELDLAWSMLEEWRDVESETGHQRGFRGWLRACWLRRSGRAGEALPLARGACLEGLRDGEYPVQLTSGIELVRVLLTLGEVDTAREPLGWLLRLRSTEVSEHGYVLRVLLADYHLARARKLAGLPALDTEFHHLYEARQGELPREPARARGALARARSAYERARVRGERLDSLLDCRLRTWQIATRLSGVEQTSEEIG